MRGWLFGLPLRFQIMVPFSIVVVLLVVLAFGFGLPLAQRAVQENVDLKLSSSRSLSLLLLDHEADQLRRTALILGRGQEVRQALAGGDLASLEALASELEPDVLAVFTPAGHLVWDSGYLGSADAVSLSPLAARAGAEGSALGIVPSAGEAVLLAVSPVRGLEGEQLFVALGRPVSRQLWNLRQAVGAELAFYWGGELLATTFPPQHGQIPLEIREPPQLMGAAGPEEQRGMSVSGRAYAVAYDELRADGDVLGTVGVFVPRSEVLSTDRLVALAVAAALAVSLGLLVLGYAVARILATRLERVVQVIERIGAGELSRRVVVDSGDEVGRLGRVVNRMAEDLQAVEAQKAEFLAMASHELRGPLAVIRSSAELLMEAGDRQSPAGRRELLQAIASNTDRLERRVRDLLDLARIRAGHFALSRRPTNLARLLREVARGLQPMLEEKGQALTLRLPPHLPLVEVDPDRIQQVIINLLSNASRHTPPGTHVWLRLKEAGRELLVEVEDNGPGIPAERRERLFQGRGPAGGESAGLGLRIVEELVRLHGGRVWAEPRPGGGSRFLFTVPCLDRSGLERGVISHEDPGSGRRTRVRASPQSGL